MSATPPGQPPRSSKTLTSTSVATCTPLTGGTAYTVELELIGLGLPPMPLNLEAGVRHALEVLRAAAYAEYDAAIFAQMETIGITDPEAIALLIVDVRKRRQPAGDPRATYPLEFRPGVGNDPDLHPFITVLLGGRQVAQMSTRQARQHAHQVLEAVLAIAPADSAYFGVLAESMGLDRPRCTAVVHDLGAVLPEMEKRSARDD